MAKNSLAKNTALYSIGEILPRALSFILLPVYTRYLSPADYGVSSYTNTIIMFLYILGAFGFNSYVLRYYFIYKDEEKKRALIGTAHYVIILMNFIILGLAFLLMPFLIDHFDIQVPWDPYFKLAFVINFFDCLSVIPMVVYRVRQDAMRFVVLGFSRTILTTIITVYYLTVENRGLIGLFQAQLYVVVPYAFVYQYIMHKYSQLTINLDYLKEGIKYAAPLVPGSISFILLSMSDRVILERNVEIGELGIYNVACQLSLVLNIIIQSGYKAIEPELFKRFGQEGFYDFVRKIQSFFFCMIYAGALGLCLISQEVFVIMTSESFHKAYLLVPALIVGVIMTGQNVIYSGILRGEKRTKIVGTATVVGAVVSVSMNIVMIPYYGTYAAAVTSAICFFVMNTILFCTMTYPGKSMWRETILVILVPVISYIVFSFFKEISALGIVVKILSLVIYTRLAFYLLNIDWGYVLNIFVPTKRI